MTENHIIGDNSDILRIWDDLRYRGGPRRRKRLFPKLAKQRPPRKTRWRRSYFHPERLEKDAIRQAERLQSALSRCHVRAASCVGSVDPSSTDSRRRREGLYTNPAAPRFLHPLLMAALEPIEKNEGLRKVTILDRSWDTNIGYLHYDPARMRRMVRRAFRHCNGIFAIEFAINRDSGVPLEDWSVRFHVEGFCWGKETERQARNANRLFTTGLVGIPPVVRKPVYDLPGAAAYVIKHPYRLYDSYQGPDHTTYRTVTDPPMRCMHAIWHRFRFTGWTEMLFAVNDGKHVLKDFNARIDNSNTWWSRSRE